MAFSLPSSKQNGVLSQMETLMTSYREVPKLLENMILHFYFIINYKKQPRVLTYLDFCAKAGAHAIREGVTKLRTRRI